MKKVVIFIASILLFCSSFLYATDVGSLLELYNVKDDLTGSYTQNDNIDLSPTNPSNVLDWVSEKSYLIGDYVKQGTSPTYTYICITANTDGTFTPSKWTQLWESAEGWKPIGYDPTNIKASQFLGTYDSGDYSISNLYINRPNECNVGLFGHVGYDAGGVEIVRVKLSSVTVVGGRGTGSLIGRVTGDPNTLTFRCSSAGGSVTGDAAVGGLVGSHNSYSSSPSNRNEQPILRECWATTSVSWSRKDAAALKFGGLVGCNEKGNIYNSWAGGSVTVDNDEQVGSIVPEKIGGLAGCILIRGLIENCFSYGQVTTYVATGQDNDVALVGGFVGGGGIGGSNGNAYGCFFDALTTNPSTTITPTSISGVTKKSTTLMKTPSTYTGWDTTIWNLVAESYPVLKANPHATTKTIALTDGSEFTASVTPGSNDQAIGRFAVSADDTGSALTRVTIRLDGTRTGVSNFKLWKCSDATFVTDTQKGTTVVTDPGTGEYVSFAFDDALTTTTVYYFLSCDVASDATGTIQGFLEDNTSLTFYDGEISSTITNVPLSNGGATLPVELSTFTGQYINSVPTLYWSTQTETDNLGWNVYRNKENDFTSADRVNNDLIPGHGTTSQMQNYIYEDVNGPLEVGDNYWYWLESIDYSGTVNHYDRVALIHIPEIQNPDPHIAVPRKYGLQSGPNPFNSNLTVSYMLPQTDMVRVEIYNMTGQLVAQFNEGLRTADRKYEIEWDGKDIYGQNVASGVLLIKLITSEDSETTKAILLR